MGERELEQLEAVEMDVEVPLELLQRAGFRLAGGRGGRSGSRALGPALGAEQRAEPAPQRETLRRRRRAPASASTTPAPAAAARAAAYFTACITSDTLCPPNPNEFEIAAVTRAARA